MANFLTFSLSGLSDTQLQDIINITTQEITLRDKLQKEKEKNMQEAYNSTYIMVMRNFGPKAFNLKN